MFRDRTNIQHLNSLYLVGIILQQVWAIRMNMSFLTIIVAQYQGSRPLQLPTVALLQGRSRGSLQFFVHIKSGGNNDLAFSVKGLCKMWFLFSASNWLHLWFISFQSLQSLCIINQSMMINRKYWHFLNFPLQCEAHFYQKMPLLLLIIIFKLIVHKV